MDTLFEQRQGKTILRNGDVMKSCGTLLNHVAYGMLCD